MTKYDLAAIWEIHYSYEFSNPDVDAAMDTMVDNPYVHHIPTMTGGVGYDQVKRFYQGHLIGLAPADFQLRPVSRTIGKDTLVDEMVCSFTHY